MDKRHFSMCRGSHRRKIQRFEHIATMILLGLGLVGFCRIAQAESFSFTSLDVPGSSGTYAFGISDAGQVVGYTYNPSETIDGFPTTHGFLDTNGTFTRIDPPGAALTYPRAINSTGQIVGTYATQPYEPPNVFAFSYSGGLFTQVAFPGATSNYVSSINNNGTIVGTAILNSASISFLYKDGVFTTAGVPAGALAINDIGQIAGAYLITSSGNHGFIYTNGILKTVDFPGALSTTLVAINNSGQVIGSYLTPSGIGYVNVSFLYSDGNFTTINVPGSLPETTYAAGINDAGQIVGYFEDNSGFHGFVATPVPEPTSLLLFILAGVPGVGAIIRYKLAHRA